MKSAQLNLAREPFVNLRPIRRLTWILWVIATLLLTANTVFYWRYFSGQEHRTDLLEELEAGIVREQAEIARLEQELDGLDLDGQNQQTVFLNSRISQRIFSWSHLFDRLAEVLPEDVHLNRVSPRIDWSGSAGRSGKSTAAADERVHLGVTGVAKSDTALLALVDGLFSHPSFVRPDLSREARKSQQQFDFSLDVIYLPGRSPRPVAAVDQEVAVLELDEDDELEEVEVVPVEETEADVSAEGDA
ncbi:MAG: PilN domain-containing protein [Thermoanaerobaculia bacterium]